MATVSMGVRLDKDVAEQVKLLAAFLGTNVNQVINRAIEDLLAQYAERLEAWLPAHQAAQEALERAATYAAVLQEEGE